MSRATKRNRRMIFQYLQTVALLLALVAPFPFIVNCNDSSYVDQYEHQDPWASPRFTYFGQKHPAGSVMEGLRKDGGTSISVGFSLIGDGSIPGAEVSWTPPVGATGFVFPDLQPSNPGGPPPFLFTSVPTHDEPPDQPDITVQYTPPSVPGEYTLLDTAIATADDGTEEGWSLSHLAGSSATMVGKQLHPTPTRAASANTSGQGWKWHVWLDPKDHTRDLAQSEAQSMIDYLQSGAFFVGLRFPVPQEADALAYRLPVVMAPDNLPEFAILDGTLPYQGYELSQSVGSVPLDFAPSRQEFFENELPEVSGTRWVALAPRHDPVQLLDRFPLAGGNWGLFTTGMLDLSAMPDSCRDCTVEVYLCHEGSEEPAFLSALEASAAAMGHKAYQGQGITCLGPLVQRLIEAGGETPPDPPFYFGGPGLSWITPPTQAKLYHLFYVAGSSPVTVNLTTSSTAGLNWSLYRGSYQEPDMSRPITGPLTLQAQASEPIWLVADVPSGTSGPENVTLTATSTADPSKSTQTTTTLWIGDWQAPPGASWSGWIPVASHAEGAHGSRWRTDLGLLNPGTASTDAEIRLHTTDGVLSMVRTVAPGAQLILEDMVGQVPYSGSASVEVRVPQALVVTSRSYSQVGAEATCYPGGTLGQNLDATAAGGGISAGQSAWIPQLTETAAYRSNIGVVNTGTGDAQVTIRLYDGSGAELTSFDMALPAGIWKQDNRPFNARAGMSDLEAGYARIEVVSGSGIVAYGSVVDNLTNDPTTMPMVPSDGGAKVSWIPVASHASGAQGSRWRTDLGLLNPGAAATDAEIRLHTTDGVLTMNRTVAAGAQLIIADMVGQIPYTGSASVEITADQPLVVTSRSYSQVGAEATCYPGGTLGQNLDATAAGGGISAGQSAWIPQLTETAAYRSNIGVVNTGTGDAQVTIHLYDGSGTELTSFEMALPAGIWKQDNRPFNARAGTSDLDAGYAKIEVVSGSGIVAYGSVVDNLTNDPTTMPMVR